MDVGTFFARRCRGLTLIELMTTLAVVGISLAILVPGWYGLTNRNQISSTSNQLLGHLRYARSEAVSRYSDISLCPSEDGIACSGDPRGWQNGYIIFVDPDGDRSRTEDEELLWHQQSQARNLRLHSTAGRPAGTSATGCGGSCTCGGGSRSTVATARRGERSGGLALRASPAGLSRGGRRA